MRDGSRGDGGYSKLSFQEAGSQKTGEEKVVEPTNRDFFHNDEQKAKIRKKSSRVACVPSAFCDSATTKKKKRRKVKGAFSEIGSGNGKGEAVLKS